MPFCELNIWVGAQLDRTCSRPCLSSYLPFILQYMSIPLLPALGMRGPRPIVPLANRLSYGLVQQRD